MSAPYTVEPYGKPCDRCGAGGAFVILGPGNDTWGVVFDDCGEADETCRMLNLAYERGVLDGRTQARKEFTR